MSKSLFAYFSQGGTSARAAESVATGLRAAEYQVALCNLVGRQAPALDGCDLLGGNTPIRSDRFSHMSE